MYEKTFPREPVDTTTGDPCIPVDGNFFIWTSTNTMFMFCRYKMKIEEDLRMKNEEDQRSQKTENEDKEHQRQRA
jgi:hypothetical protein